MTPIAPVELQTSRLTLRPLTDADAEGLLEVHADANVARYARMPVWTGLEQARELISQSRAWWSTGQHVCLGIERKDAAGCIGTCTLFDIRRASRRAEIGFVLGARSWRQGYMTEALTAVLDFAFRDLGLNRVEADTDPRNGAATALLEKLGFAREGVLRERWITAGEKSDTAWYGLLRSEWPRATEGAVPGGDLAPDEAPA